MIFKKEILYSWFVYLGILKYLKKVILMRIGLSTPWISMDLSIPVLSRPVGLPYRQGFFNDHDVKAWMVDKKPNILQRTNYGTYTGIGATVLGAVLGFFGFKNDNGLIKWGGTAFSLIGLVVGSLSVLGRVRLPEEGLTVDKTKTDEELIELLKDKDSIYEAIGELGKRKVADAHEHLLKLITDEREMVRSDAIQALVKINFHGLNEEFRKLLNNENPSILADGIFGLGLLRDKGSVDLIKNCWDENNAGLTKDILDALIRIDENTGAEFVLELIADKAGADLVYEEAITSLAKLSRENKEKAIEPLGSIFLNKDIDNERRGQAARGFQVLLEAGIDSDKVFNSLDTMKDRIENSKLSDIKVSHSGGHFIGAVCQRYNITV